MLPIGSPPPSSSSTPPLCLAPHAEPRPWILLASCLCMSETWSCQFRPQLPCPAALLTSPALPPSAPPGQNSHPGAPADSRPHQNPACCRKLSQLRSLGTVQGHCVLLSTACLKQPCPTAAPAPLAVPPPLLTLTSSACSPELLGQSCPSCPPPAPLALPPAPAHLYHLCVLPGNSWVNPVPPALPLPILLSFNPSCSPSAPLALSLPLLLSPSPPSSPCPSYPAPSPCSLCQFCVLPGSSWGCPLSLLFFPCLFCSPPASYALPLPLLPSPPLLTLISSACSPELLGVALPLLPSSLSLLPCPLPLLTCTSSVCPQELLGQLSVPSAVLLPLLTSPCCPC